MLTFSLGELSTIEGLHQDPSFLSLGYAGLTKVFNFTDLPCPPRSVMVGLTIPLQHWYHTRLTYLQEANWYTPEPGQPYRPLLALPSQLQAWNPAFKNCKDLFFQGYDPPRALVPAAAMVQAVTQADPRPSPIPPRPSATPDPGPKETDPASIPTPASVHKPKAPQSSQKFGLQPESGVESSGSKPVTLSAENGKTGQEKNPNLPNYQVATDEGHEEKGDPKVSAMNNADEKQKTDPNGSAISNTDENSRQKKYPEQNPHGDSDAGSGQGASSNFDHSGGAQNKPSQGVQQADSSQAADQKQSDGGLKGSLFPWKAPPEQQGNSIAIGSQKPGQATTINNHIVQPLLDAISIAGTTVFPGAPPITVSDTPVALGPSSLVVGSVSVAVALPPLSLSAGQLITLNHQPIQQLSTGILVAGTTLTPGAPPVKVSGIPVSLGPSAVIIGSSSIPIALPRPPWIPGPITNIDGKAIQPLSNGISVGGTTLTPGGPALTISGTPMSLGSNALVIGTSSILFATDDPIRLLTTIAGQTITANPNAMQIGSSKLTPGSPGLILSGTLVSLDSAGQLVVGSETIPLERAGGGEIVTTVAGQYLTANPTAVRVASSTLTPGGPGMTLSGTMISLDSSGRLFIGATTLALQPSIENSGRLIIGGFQSGAPYASGSVGSGNIASSKNGTGNDVQAFQGIAQSLQSRSAGILLPWLLCACLTRLYR